MVFNSPFTKPYILSSPTAALEQSLRAVWDAASWAAVLILPQIKLNAQLSSCTSFSINSTYRPGEFIFQCPTFLPFYTIYGVLKARILKWLPFPSPADHILSDLSIMTRPSWVALQAWLGFIELDRVVVLVWLDWLVFYEYRFSVSALWCPLATPTILLGFLLPWAWGISSWLLQQSTAAAAYLGRGVSPYKEWWLCRHRRA